MKELIIATRNKGKANEFKDFFQPYGIETKSLLDFDETLPEIEETGSTFKENAALKAEGILAHLHIPVLADDSGLVVDALDGRPGVYSARYAGENSTDQRNIDKVMNELLDIPSNQRTARFVSVLAIAIPAQETIFKKGVCEGSIALKQQGENGFGYDPIFIPSGYTKTMAQLMSREKNSISHRSDAIRQLKDWIEHFR